MIGLLELNVTLATTTNLLIGVLVSTASIARRYPMMPSAGNDRHVYPGEHRDADSFLHCTEEAPFLSLLFVWQQQSEPRRKLPCYSKNGAVVIPARVAKPKDETKAESVVFVTERWILATLRNHILFSLDELNQAIAEKL